jgi:hypothetical protein
MEIKSKEIKLLDIESIICNPKNNNKHPAEQIKILEKNIKYQGFRNPLVISGRSGFLIAGHGRLEAAKNLGIKKIPVMIQDFENEAQEYAYLTSDNAIAAWAEIDLSLINMEISDLGMDFDIDLLGIKDFKLIEPEEVSMPVMDGKDPDCQQVTFTLSNEQKDFLDEAMKKAKSELDCTDGINQNANGNIVGAIMRNYVNS